jgi:hypothetical protein
VIQQHREPLKDEEALAFSKPPRRPPPGRTTAIVPRAQQRRTGSGALRHQWNQQSAKLNVPTAQRPSLQLFCSG